MEAAIDELAFGAVSRCIEVAKWCEQFVADVALAVVELVQWHDVQVEKQQL